MSVYLLVQLLVCSILAVSYAPNAFQLKTVYRSRCKDPVRSFVQVNGQKIDDESAVPGMISADSIYFDIEIANEPIGRLIFHLTNPSSLPKHAENIIQLAKGSRRGIDPKAHYIGCEFDFSPAAIEDGMGRYRWSHQVKGRGRNGIGKPGELITESQAGCCHSTYGGQYYGDVYSKIGNDPGVLLTVPIVGPGYGTSKFSIVRVEESPKEWRETLLINSGVIGRLDQSSLGVLQAVSLLRLDDTDL